MPKQKEEQRELFSEIEKRIESLENDPEAMPKRFGRGDYLFVFAVAALCLLAVIGGAWL
jgi:hypothetical protein